MVESPLIISVREDVQQQLLSENGTPKGAWCEHHKSIVCGCSTCVNRCPYSLELANQYVIDTNVTACTTVY